MFSEKILYIFGLIYELIWGMYDFSLRCGFWEEWTLVFISHTEHENNIEDDFT